MDVPHQLETLLQSLVTDASSVTHLAYILNHLSTSCLAPSLHLQKWITRVTSLMHSRDPAARWAAICIAHRMSFLSNSLLVENAQSWIAIIFPSLTKPEPVPLLKVSMRYLALVLSAATHNLEFQRQVTIPVVPKVSLALLAVAEKHNDRDIKISSIRTLTRLIPLYPSLHKALTQRLFTLCHEIFSGSMHYMAGDLLNAAVDLYAVLHFMGGKVGGANLWRNCLDEVLQSSWSAWLALRTTFPASAQLSHRAIAHFRAPDGKLPSITSQADAMACNPLTTITLNLDRLKCGVSAIMALLSVPVNRPVRVPIGSLASFCWCLLASTRGDEGRTHLDPHVRVAESEAVPHIWTQACSLLSRLAQAAQESLAPHMPRLIAAISSHLENNLEPSQRRTFLRCAHHLLYFCPAIGATLAINRLVKVAISLLSPLYLQYPRSEPNPATTGQLRMKKRRGEYEADSVLATSNTTICVTADERDTLMGALDVMGQCLLNAELALSTRSLANRVALSILLSLPSVAPSSLSSDPCFHGRVVMKVRDMCVEGVQGTQHAMSKGTGLVLRSVSFESLMARDKLHSQVDLLLHPRRPPYVRMLPPAESVSLSSTEESAEETAIRQTLGLAFGKGKTHSAAPEPQTNPKRAPNEPAIQGSLDPAQEQALPISIEPDPQTGSNANSNLLMEVPTRMPAILPLQNVPDISGRSSLPVASEGPVPSVYTVPMLVDESDHEEVPTIDLASDSDT